MTPGREAPDLLQRMLELWRERSGREDAGTVIHLRGMEGLRSVEMRAVVQIIRQLKHALLVPGYHFLLTATGDSMRSFRRREDRKERLFPDGVVLKPASPGDFGELLERRYSRFALDPERAPAAPLPPSAALRVYALFGGDITGTLKALERLVTILHRDPAAGRGDPCATLHPVYRTEARATLTDSQLRCLDSLAQIESATFVQAELEPLWRMKQSRISNVLAGLVEGDWVRKEGWEGRVIHYALTGAGRLALG